MQEEINREFLALGTQAAKLTAQLLEEMMREALKRLGGMEKGLVNAVNSVVDKNPTLKAINHLEIKSSNKMTVEELMKQNGGGATATMSIDDLKDWDKTAKQYGVEYAVKRSAVLDADGKQVMDDSKCTYVDDYSKCNIVKHADGSPVLGEDGKPQLAPGSPEPEKKLAPNSPKPQPVYQYTVFFHAKDTEVITQAFKDYTQQHDKKLQKQQQRKERPRVNIKEMIAKFKAKSDELNKDSPEKHHKRGEHSL
ncbi:MAG: PcfB family protein [Lachnospiraceae bacterium]|nr:PcfB family protein [Lachnospiraceae bacterium]